MTLKDWIIAAAAALTVATAPCASAEGNPRKYRGEKTVGLAAGYHSYNHSGAAGLLFTYRFSEHFRLAPSAEYVFRHHNQDALVINLNAEVPFQVHPRCDIFPYAGINYSSWNRHGALRHTDDNHDVGNRTSRLGLNAGAGVNFHASTSMRLGLVAGYAFVKDYGGALVMVSIGYSF